MAKTLERGSSLEQAIQEAIAEARALCANGGTSAECAVAWDIVEELQAERSHQQAKHAETEFERYCDDYPDALEARIYEV
ncbi:MAG TPA: Calvin cycle protein CP12 [Crinalium sp.]|jgi:hypothetical protein